MGNNGLSGPSPEKSNQIPKVKLKHVWQLLHYKNQATQARIISSFSLNFFILLNLKGQKLFRCLSANPFKSKK